LAGELKHKDVGPELTYNEYHATDSHTIDGVDAGTVISGKATLAEVKADTDIATAITNSHASGSDNQVIPDELADLSDDATHRLVTDTEKSTWNGKTDLATVKADVDIASAISLKHSNALDHSNTLDHTQGTDQGLDTGGLNAVTAAEVKGAVTNSHAPGSDNQTIPDQLSDLSDDATHRLVTDTEKSTWNGKTDLSTVKADTDVASAISLKHTQGTDQGLDTGGANAVTAAQAKAGYTHSGTSHAPADAVSLATVKADADVSDAISKKHSAVTVSAPISLSGQALSLVNDAAATITEIDTGALANSDTVIPTSKAVTTAIAGVGSGGFGGLYVNLSIKNNSTNPNYQMDVSATTILLENSSKAILRIDALSEAVDITASGVNGLDTGSEAGSTWYHIWAIAKADGTKDCLLSASATAPTLPDGYTYKAYLGAVYNDSGSDFDSIYQINETVAIASVNVSNGGTQTSLTALDLSAIIPTTAKFAIPDARANTTSGAGTVAVQLACDSSGVGARNGQFYSDGTGYMGGIQPEIPIKESQTIYYVTNSGNRVFINIAGWKF
jgi:hypothetical protein